MKARYILSMIAITIAMMFVVSGCGDGGGENDNIPPPQDSSNPGVLKGPWVIYQDDGYVCVLVELYDYVYDISITTSPGDTVNTHFTHKWDITGWIDDRVLHWFEVSKLEPDTHYDYTIYYTMGFAPEEIPVRYETKGSFHTPPDKMNGILKFFGYGDTKVDAEDTDKLNTMLAVAEEMDAYSHELHPSFIIHTGDIVPLGGSQIHYSYDKAEVKDSWRDNFFGLGDVQSLVNHNGIFTSVGNHDIDDNGVISTYNYWKHFPYHEYDGRVNEDSHAAGDMYYKFDWGPAQFYSLTTYPPESEEDWYCGPVTSLEHDGEQYNWLEDQLQKASDRQWKIVFLHIPAYSPGCNQGQLQNYFKPLFETYGVDMVLQGHEHYYSRITKPGPFGNPNGIPYLVLGGGGAGLSDWDSDDTTGYEIVKELHHWGNFEIVGDTLRAEIKHLHGDYIDSFTLDKVPVANFKVTKNDDGSCEFMSMETGNVNMSIATGNVKEVEWKFPDGTTSSDQNKAKECEAGVIQLTAKSTFHSSTAVMNATSDNIYNVGFTADKTTGPIGTVVTFKPFEVTQWAIDEWRIGNDLIDKHNQSYEGFDYTFSTHGKFRVERQVGTNEGDITHMAIEDFICIEPYSRFTFLPQEGKVNEEIKFYNESVGDGLTYRWDFGDGGSSTNEHLNYTFSSPGTYNVKLTITDGDGLKDSESRIVTIAE
jgi:hypothetical protein